MASEPRNYPDYVFVAYDEDFSAQTYDIAVSLEPGNLVGRPVKYIRHDLNTLPAPAATDTGLVTVLERPYLGSLVARSQAEELLAAERAEKEALRRAIMGKEPAPELQHGNFLEMAATLHRACDGARKRAEYAEQRLGQSEAELKQARADNAAQAVRIKELNANTDTLMTECHRVSKESGDQFREMRGQIEALETKLAAATETAARAAYRACAETRHVSLGHAAADAVRAVLGGKPSC